MRYFHVTHYNFFHHTIVQKEGKVKEHSMKGNHHAEQTRRETLIGKVGIRLVNIFVCRKNGNYPIGA